MAEAKVKKVKALSIVSSREGFRRAGRAFGREATVIPVSELSRDEIKLLKNEAMLVVSEVETDAPADAQDSGAGKAAE
ncbi:MAG: HI1506-related protein [Gallionella sp.]|nr:HI1506-related protein [Gallionella sp.]